MKLMCLLSYLTLCSSQEWIAHSSSSYYFSDTNRSWTEAQAHCINMSSNLTSVTSVDESEFINRTLGSNRVTGHWIGLYRASDVVCPCTTLSDDALVRSRTNEECVSRTEYYTCCECRERWTWADGTPMLYMNWIQSEPTGYEQCGRIDSPNAAVRPDDPDIKIFSWYDSPCDTQFRYICKRPVAGASTSGPRTLVTGPSTSVTGPSTSVTGPSMPVTGPSTSTTPDSEMSDKKEQDDSLIIGLSVGLGLVLLVVVIVIVVLLLRHRRKNPQHGSKQQTADSHYDEISAAEYVNQAAITNDNQKPSPSSGPQYSTSYAQVILPASKKPKPLTPKPAVEKEIKYADIDFGDSPVTHTQNGNEYSSAGSLYNQPHLSYDEDSLGYARTEGVSGIHMGKRTDDATHNNNNKPTPISPGQISAMYATPVKKNKAKKPEVLRKPAPNNPGVMYAMPVKK